MKRFFRHGFVAAALVAGTVALSACVYYPARPAYGYGYAPGYYYGPPVYGSVVVGDGWGHRGWR